MPDVRAILWDLDGVIVSSGPHHFQAYRETLSPLGVDLTEERFFRELFGRRNYDIIDALLPGVSESEAREIAARKEEAFRGLVRGNVTALPGAGPLIRRATAAGLRQAIVSSTPRANIELILESLGFEDQVDAIVGEEDASRGKPDPEGCLTAAGRLGVSPGRCVVIEDAPEGVQAAKSAGMRCIAVTTTRPGERLGHADLVVASLEDERVMRFLGLEGA